MTTGSTVRAAKQLRPWADDDATMTLGVPKPQSDKSRTKSLRQQLLEVLEEGPYSLRDLSQLVSAREREVAAHLEHVRQSARGRGLRFTISPAVCLKCEFSFDDRSRLTAPSRCPNCRSERIEAPRFVLQ